MVGLIPSQILYPSSNPSYISGREYTDTSLTLLLPDQPPPDWKRAEEWALKYVDDLNLGQHHFMETAISYWTTGKEKKLLHADECESTFEFVILNANRIGMKVNKAKTQLICISSNRTSIMDSYIMCDGRPLYSQNSIKMLGFILDSNAGMTAHINHIKRCVSARLWMIIHLKRVGIKNDQLTKIYLTIIRPIIEYACQLYHHMITAKQSSILEGLQRRVLKIVTGPGVSYRDALTLLNVPGLDERSKILCEKFAIKAEKK